MPHANRAEPDLIFRRNLDSELEKISSFYDLKENELLKEVFDLSLEAKAFEDGDETGSEIFGEPSNRRRRSVGPGLSRTMSHQSYQSHQSDQSRQSHGDDESEISGEEGEGGANSGLLSRLKRGRTWGGSQTSHRSNHSHERPGFRRRDSQAYDDYHEQSIGAMYDKRIMLKKRSISLFVALRELKSFVQLNRTGFSKALKKYDKILNRNLKDEYIPSVIEPCYCFRKATSTELDKAIAKIEEIYANLITKGDINDAKKELRLHLREHVVWERNTVWRDMIGIERKAQAANMGLRRTLLGDNADPAKARLTGDEPEISTTKELATPVGRIKYPTWLFSSGFFTLCGILAIFTILLIVPISKSPEQQNCFAMLVFVSLLWATEVSDWNFKSILGSY